MAGTALAAKLLISAAHPQQFPPETQADDRFEIAFLGRSNVGKSSLLNRLAHQPGLAFTSSRPGCTRLINFFEIDDEDKARRPRSRATKEKRSFSGLGRESRVRCARSKIRLVDLPGYGYAQVPLEERASWKKLIESYLKERRSLALSFLILDARRGWMDMDLELKAWLEFHNRRYQVIATKIDKLKGNNQLKAGLDAIRKEIPERQLIPFSAIDGRGVREIWQTISKIKNKQ